MKTPLPNTYWVLPGRALAGEHPSGEGKSDTLARLKCLHEAGIDYFIDLTEAGEMPEYRRLLPAKSYYLRCPMRDQEVPGDVALMHELQSRIRTALKLDRRIYIHCRAGIGRTGVVVGCYLAEDGLDGRAALKRLNQLWRQSERSQSWPAVPQTDEQTAYILEWRARRTPPRELRPPRRRSR